MRADLKISVGKTRSAPTCVKGLTRSNFASKKARDPLRSVAGLHNKIVSKITTVEIQLTIDDIMDPQGLISNILHVSCACSHAIYYKKRMTVIR